MRGFGPLGRAVLLSALVLVVAPPAQAQIQQGHDDATITVESVVVQGQPITQDLHTIQIRVDAVRRPWDTYHFRVSVDGELIDEYALPREPFTEWSGEFGPVDATATGGLEAGVPHMLTIDCDCSIPPFNVEFTIQPNSATLGEDPEVEAAAIEFYTGNYSVTADQARSRLRFQDEARRVDDRVINALGADYTGIWFDHEASEGRLKVGVRGPAGSPPSGANVEAAKDILRDAGLLSRTDFVTMPATRAALEAEQPVLDSRLSNLLAVGKVRTSVSPSRSALVVAVATDATSAEIAQVDQAIALSAVPAVRTSMGRPSGQTALAACKRGIIIDGRHLFGCSSPLRGGPAIFIDNVGSGTGQGLCSAGFTAQSNSDSKRYLVTAGHCVLDGSAVGEEWYVLGSSGLAREQGVAHNAIYGRDGDIAILQLDPSLPDAFRPRPWVAVWGVDDKETDTTTEPSYEIRRTTLSHEGDIVCTTSGIRLPNRKYTDCGVVKEIGVSEPQQPGGPVIGRLALVRGMCAIDGTSGGPVYKERKAFGIVVGILAGPNGNADNDGCETTYQGISRVQQEMNVTILKG